MKIASVFLVPAFLTVAMAFAESPADSASKTENPIIEATKKPRKKKVEMCSECGKPEKDCECHGHKKADPGSRTKDR